MNPVAIHINHINIMKIIIHYIFLMHSRSMDEDVAWPSAKDFSSRGASSTFCPMIISVASSGVEAMELSNNRMI